MWLTPVVFPVEDYRQEAISLEFHIVWLWFYYSLNSYSAVLLDSRDSSVGDIIKKQKENVSLTFGVLFFIRIIRKAYGAVSRIFTHYFHTIYYLCDFSTAH